jgi:threonine dehydratase
VTVAARAAIPLAEIEAARERIRGKALRTSLVPLNADGAPAEIHLKLELLQPIGSFKLRGATNAIELAGREAVADGLWTASAGNMSQAVAWCARRLGVPCTVVVPETAAGVKVAATERLGARIVRVSLADWLEVFRTRRFEGLDGFFVHAFDDPAVMAGNGTIGLELVEDLPDLDAVVIPYGGGGLFCGIASAVRALAPSCRIYAAEVETGAPLAASLAAGRPVEIDYRTSFVDGIGAPVVFEEVFELTRRLIDESIVLSLDEIAAAVRLLAERSHVVAEGAGAAPVAAALWGRAGGGKIACVVSGGNIAGEQLATILRGQTP